MAGWRVASRDGSRASCGHTGALPAQAVAAMECEDCVREGTSWVHLRRCLACEHVGCCDSSPRRHASVHWQAADHPVAASAEPDERWAWCYADQLVLVPAGRPG